jgi:hypothetical protein
MKQSISVSDLNSFPKALTDGFLFYFYPEGLKQKRLANLKQKFLEKHPANAEWRTKKEKTDNRAWAEASLTPVSLKKLECYFGNRREYK